LVATRTPLLPPQPLSSFPAWIWAGGVIGASMVLAATVLVPRLGAGALFCLIVLGQVLGAMALDHFGVLGAQRPVDMARVAGALLVVVGAALDRKSTRLNSSHVKISYAVFCLKK